MLEKLKLPKTLKKNNNKLGKDQQGRTVLVFEWELSFSHKKLGPFGFCALAKLDGIQNGHEYSYVSSLFWYK